MDPVLEKLLDLDRLEKDRQASECAVGDLPAQIHAIENDLAVRRKALSLLQKNIEQREQELYAASNQVIARNSEINRLQENLAAISNNREYDALHVGIMRQQEALTQILQRQSRLREELEILRADHASREAESKLSELTMRNDLAAKRDILSHLQSGIETLERQVKELLRDLPAETVQDWELLAESRRKRPSGSPWRSLVSAMAPGDGHCKICYTELTRNFLHALKETGTVLNCPACGAFLVSQNPSEKRLA